MKKNAFTLIELLILIAIFSLLIALLVPVTTATYHTAKKRNLEAAKSLTNSPALTVSNLPSVAPVGTNNVLIVTNITSQTNK